MEEPGFPPRFPIRNRTNRLGVHRLGAAHRFRAATLHGVPSDGKS